MLVLFLPTLQGDRTIKNNDSDFGGQRYLSETQLNINFVLPTLQGNVGDRTNANALQGIALFTSGRYTLELVRLDLVEEATRINE